MSNLEDPQRNPRLLRAIIIGAGDGMGAQFAHALAARGARLVLVDRDEIALARMRQDIEAVAIRCDVLDEQSVRDMFGAAEAVFGQADLLINAAGGGYVRTLGVMRSSREFARRPRETKAYIVNIGTDCDQLGASFDYAGSEVAFSRLAEGLAKAIECADLRILTVNRMATTDAVADLAEQLIRELSVGPDQGGDNKDARLA